MADYPDAEEGDTTETDPEMMEAIAALERRPKPIRRRILDIILAWEWTRQFERSEDLWFFIRWARFHHINLPKAIQHLRIDPTMVQDTEEFLDMIRDVYYCMELGLEINKFMLTWKTHEGVFRHSPLPNGWEAAKDILMDPCNTHFVVYLILQCAGEAPGEISNLLHSQSMDRERMERLNSGGW